MRINPYLQVIIAGILWGLSGVFIKFAQLPPTSFAFFRLSIPIIVLSIYFFGVLKMPLNFYKKGNFKWMFTASVINGIRMFFYLIAFLNTTIGNAVVMLYTWPFFATMYGVIFLKEKVSGRQIMLLLMAFCGILLIYSNKAFSFQNQDFIGMGAMLIAAAMYASTVVIFKTHVKEYTQLETVYFQNFIGSLIFLPFIFINRPFPELQQVFYASCHAIFLGLIGFGLFFNALRYIKASSASLLSYIEALSGLIFGILIFNEALTWNLAGGGLLILGSAILLRKS